MANVPRASLLFNNLRRVVVKPRSKTTFTYEVDKTGAQRWITKQVAKIKEQQKFYSVFYCVNFNEITCQILIFYFLRIHMYQCGGKHQLTKH